MDLGSREGSPELAEWVGERSELVPIGEESQAQYGQEVVETEVPDPPQNTPEEEVVVVKMVVENPPWKI